MILNSKNQIYYVCSYPKSGATWFRFLMYTCTHGVLEQSANVNYFYLTTRIQDGKIKEKLGTGQSFFVKSHYPYHKELPFKEDIRVCIYIVRNPFNTLLSRIDHYMLEGLDYAGQEAGKNEIIENFIQYADAGIDPEGPGKYAGGWNHNVVSWLETNRDIPVYLIRYEDLLEDTIGVIASMNEALGLGFTDANIEKGCQLSSFENMRRLEQYEMEHEVRGAFYSPTRKRVYIEKQIQFINKGTKRDYEAELSPEWIEKARKVLEKGMRLAGYWDGHC